MRQVDLAHQTGVGLRTIRQIEQTDFEPRLATARKLATALNVRVEWLVFGIGPMTDTAEHEEEGHETRSLHEPSAPLSTSGSPARSRSRVTRSMPRIVPAGSTARPMGGRSSQVYRDEGQECPHG